jgi:hypothetical protein
MKIYEIEAGEKINIKPENLKELAMKIKTECSDAYTAMENISQILYRGMLLGNSIARFFKLKPSLNIFLGKPREDRKPVDVKLETQEKYDAYLRDAGMTALRSNSIFCTTSQSDAKQYGELYMIFPKNGFEFTWSPDVKDLTNNVIQSWRHKAFPSNFAKQYTDLNKVRFDDYLKYYFSQIRFDNTHFEEALRSKNEILIRGEFYAVNQNYLKYFLLPDPEPGNSIGRRL